MNKKSLSERDICTKYITPALEKAGWDKLTQLREEVTFTAGKIIVRGKLVTRGKKKRADYILYYKPNIPIAIIEAKDNNHTISAGLQQAQDYAKTLDIPFVYSSNGDGFQEHDPTKSRGKLESEISLDQFPSPDDLWSRYCTLKDIQTEHHVIVSQDYHDDGSGKQPRYYQNIAINRTIEAIAKGKNRILLVMATGTGKTFLSFQIIWRLWKARKKKRILFLADRNILVDQTKTNDFKPFGQAMTKITKRKVDPSYEIYLALYQAVTGTEDIKNIYKDFSPDFFDLIVVDECHRGSAAEASAWHDILIYFESATHIGMTATPKETNDVSNITYFGEPIYTYSLKQGIEDGFLAPYKVIRIDLDKDIEGWRPEKGKTDKKGEVIEDRIYNQKDFDRSLVLEKRTGVVAEKITEFLKGTDRYAKAIVFCEDIDHADRMRTELSNRNDDLVKKDGRYIVKITGDDDVGKMELDNFINPEEVYPVIATTSRLMSTGVDAQTCKLIVLDRIINSMTEFKQIIGRGTRVREDFDKMYFTIMDFKKATHNFADTKFDGDPVVIYKPKKGESVVPPDETVTGDEDSQDIIDGGYDGHYGEDSPVGGKTISVSEGRVKYVVGDVTVTVVNERVQYYGDDGKLMSESLRDYTKKNLLKQYRSLEDFLRRWNKAERKQAIIEELKEQGLFIEALQEEVGKDLDPFDLICHVAFDQKPLTRRERAENVKKRDYFTKYGDKARKVMDALLEKYADEPTANIENIKLLKVSPFSELGTPLEIIDSFGGKEAYMEAVHELEEKLYKAVS